MLKRVFCLLVCLAAFSLACFALFLLYSENRTFIFIIAFNRTTNPEEPADPTVTPNSTEGSEKTLDPCPDVPPDLQGVLHVEFTTKRTLQDIRNHVGPDLQQGGRYRPTSCRAKQKVAVIIPFRNRHEHLTHWLYYVHPVLMRQQLDYGVYVINQDGDGVFNKATLMNVGFVEALKEYDYECFVFWDVDMLPIDDRNLYRCSDNPRHLAPAVDKFNFVLPYVNLFGGVTALSEQQFIKVNGFSNTFWGWGAEDDDMSQRILYKGMSISRPDSVIGRYKMIRHDRDSLNNPNPRNVQKLRETHSNMDKDGLNSLNYTVKEIRKDLLYTFVSVAVLSPPG